MTDPNINPAQVARESPPNSLGQLARRIAGRTTDLIVIGVVLIGGLTLGRDLVGWWHQEPPEPGVSLSQSTSPLFADEVGPVRFEFGNLEAALERRHFSGDREGALAALVELCRDSALASANVPSAEESAERTVLESALRAKPLLESAGAWEVHRFDEELPLVIGIRWVDTGQAAEDASADWREFRPDPAYRGKVPRLICSGLVVPNGTAHWTLYLFTHASQATATSESFPHLHLPSDARRSLGLRDRQGAGFVGFSGAGDPDAWCDQFEQSFREQGWVNESGWAKGPSHWSAQFRPASGFRGKMVEIGFSGTARRDLKGLVQFLPGPTRNTVEKGFE